MVRDPNVSGGGMVVLDHLLDPTSDARTAIGRAFGPLAWGRTFVLLGNSRIFLETASNGQQKQQRGIFTWANQRLGQRCQVLNYAGVSGDKLSLMPARYATDVAAYAPKVVLIADAVNDISAGATLTQVQGYYTDLITLNRSIGARTVLLTTNPSNAHTTAAQAVLAATNRWLKSLTDPDILVIDVTSVIAADTGLAWAPGFSTDGLHQSRRGAARMGRVVAAALDPLIPRWDLLRGPRQRRAQPAHVRHHRDRRTNRLVGVPRPRDRGHLLAGRAHRPAPRELVPSRHHRRRRRRVHDVHRAAGRGRRGR
jgi:lysophospholipase L1-like esterase